MIPPILIIIDCWLAVYPHYLLLCGLDIHEDTTLKKKMRHLQYLVRH